MHELTDEARLQAFEQALAAMREELRQAEDTLEQLGAQGKQKTATYKQLVSQKLLLRRALRYFEDRGL